MKIKTASLTGPALDWAVTQCECRGVSVDEFLKAQTASCKFSYSTVWAKGGPIIEREKICIEHREDSGGWKARIWADVLDSCFIEVGFRGPYCATPLVAAMRCFVSYRLGDEVDIPEELLK